MRHMVAEEHNESRVSQLRRGVLEYCILALLEDEERYGFDLVRALSSVQGMKTAEGTIYPILSRLRKDAVVETSWRESPSGPPRRYYRLSASGTRSLNEFREQWQVFRSSVDQLLTAGGQRG